MDNDLPTNLLSFIRQLEWKSGPTFDLFEKLLVKIERVYGLEAFWSVQLGGAIYISLKWRAETNIDPPDMELVESLFPSWLTAEFKKLVDWPNIRVRLVPEKYEDSTYKELFFVASSMA